MCDLESFAIVRNIWVKAAQITDSSMTELAKNCPNLKEISVTFSRDFEEQAMIQLQKLKNLKYLRLRSCPLFASFPAFQNLIELDLSGDSWLRHEVLIAISNFPKLIVFHMGHY